MNFIYEIRRSNYNFDQLKLMFYNKSRSVGSISLRDDGYNSGALRYVILFNEKKSEKPFALHIHTPWMSMSLFDEISYNDAIDYIVTIEGLLRHNMINRHIAATIDLNNLRYLKNQYRNMPMPKLYAL